MPGAPGPGTRSADDRGDHVAGALHQIGPGEPQHGPAQAHERVLPLPVALEPVDVGVMSHPVDLDRQPRRRDGDIEDSDQLATHPHGQVGPPVADPGPPEYPVQ